jgi:hypothetical protein
MTQMSLANPDSILSVPEVAIIGQRMHAAGLGETDIRAMLAMIEQVALTAARTAAMSTVPALMDLVKNTHATTASRIAMRLAARPGFHRQCEQVALLVGQSPPRFAMATQRDT